MHFFSKQCLILAVLAGGTYGSPMLDRSRSNIPDDLSRTIQNSNQPGDWDPISPLAPMEFTADPYRAARISRRSVFDDPFHVPDPEPGWKRRGRSHNRWPNEVSQRRIKEKLGPKSVELWTQFELCMRQEMKARRSLLMRLEGKEPTLDGYLDQNYRTATMYRILEIEAYCVDETHAQTEELARARDKRQAALWRAQEAAKANRIDQKRTAYDTRAKNTNDRRTRRRREQAAAARGRDDPDTTTNNNAPVPKEKIQADLLGWEQPQGGQVGGQGEVADEQQQQQTSTSGQVKLGGVEQSDRFSGLGDTAGRIIDGLGKGLNSQRSSHPGDATVPGLTGLLNGLGGSISKAMPVP
ncbi:MAG: hypothetical protein M1816_001719 [Peltula sp. TS41687]|nr:MAG: hypothetical protein M1816_001719 [Peltula sp. TS41687]